MQLDVSLKLEIVCIHMKKIIRFILTTFFIFYSLTNYGQEKNYKEALDSLTHYLNYGSSEYGKVNLYTYYTSYTEQKHTAEYESPGMYTAMTNNYKSKIVITVDNTIYMLNLAEMDTSFIKTGRTGICVKDLTNIKCIYHSAYSRIENGKYGGVPIDAIEIPVIGYINNIPATKEQQRDSAAQIIYYLKQAICYSKKVKTKPGEIWKEE